MYKHGMSSILTLDNAQKFSVGKKKGLFYICLVTIVSMYVTIYVDCRLKLNMLVELI